MASESADRLASRCTYAVRHGDDFQIIWQTVLKRYALTETIPDQATHGRRGLLEIRLVTGERLVYDGDARRFSVR